MDDYVTCKSCQHVRYDWKYFPFNLGNQTSWMCDKVRTKEEVETNPITGKQFVKPPERRMCVVARGEYGDCGHEGKFWTPKHKRDIFKYIARAGEFAGKDQ